MLILRQNNLGIEIDPAKVAGSYVNPSYAKAVGGIFDAESMDVAITSALLLVAGQIRLWRQPLRKVKILKEQRTQVQPC